VKNTNGSKAREAKQASAVEEDGTGIVKDEAVRRRGRWELSLVFFAAICLLTGMASTQATETPKGLIASVHGGSVMLSFHTPDGTIAGSSQASDPTETYHQVLLFSSPSSSGSSGEASLLVLGSGSGTASTEPCEEELSILVLGSGSGVASVSDECAFDDPNVWGFAEVEQVEESVQVTIYRVLDGDISLYFSTLMAP
jgi:hypothetical protein